MSDRPCKNCALGICSRHQQDRYKVALDCLEYEAKENTRKDAEIARLREQLDQAAKDRGKLARELMELRALMDRSTPQ